MPYRVHIKGLEIECDTVEELRAAVRALGSDEGAMNGRQTNRTISASSQWTAEKYSKLAFLVRKPRQRQLLRLLVAAGSKGVTTLDIQRELGTKSNNAISGLMTSIVKNAKRAGSNGHDVLIRNRVEVDGRPAIAYRLTDSLLEAAEYAKK